MFINQLGVVGSDRLANSSVHSKIVAFVNGRLNATKGLSRQ